MMELDLCFLVIMGSKFISPFLFPNPRFPFFSSSKKLQDGNIQLYGIPTLGSMVLPIWMRSFTQIRSFWNCDRSSLRWSASGDTVPKSRIDRLVSLVKG